MLNYEGKFSRLQTKRFQEEYFPAFHEVVIFSSKKRR